jgi:putative transposase
MKKYDKRGIAGIRHSKSTAGKPKTWTPDAIELWIGLCLKREHRKIDRKDLYRDCLIPECLKRGWNYGCYESANWWYDRRVNPQLLALQHGGMRALDNVLPPVLRDYSDLQPFELLVGDQHKFDRWVVDEETGEVFRQEAYLWQDLRTRIIYGAAIDKTYDSWLIGLALRIGIRCFGAFGSAYTDNGRPECSRYLMEILGNIRALGMEWQRTDETFMDVVDVDPEDINPHVIMPGTHKKAIVKNAKAKMIEGTFHILDNHIMTSHFRMPGATKKLSDDIHWQDVDQLEAKALAKAGKLLTDREHALLMYLAIDYYNREKAHRGVLREWAWKQKPSSVTPIDCLKACYDEGWRPKMISDEAADLIFLAKDSRIVHLGRISFAGEQYEHEQLLTRHKERVELRYNPMNTQELHIFDRGRYLCTAVPIEYSSMKDMDLAGRKIEEKRSRRKRFSEEFKKVTSIAPNFIEYSRVPQAEKVAALIGEDRKRRALEQKEISKQLTTEQLEAGVAKLEETGSLPRKTTKPLPPRPGYFKDDQTRYEWCIRFEAAGGSLSHDDADWKLRQEEVMPEETLEYWKAVAEYGN